MNIQYDAIMSLLFFPGWTAYLTLSELSLSSKPHPSGTHSVIEQTLRSDVQILLCDSCLILSSILERTAIRYVEN